MAENYSKKTPNAVAEKYLNVTALRNTSARSAEYLSVRYNIEKLSGLRSGKRSSSFRANTSANLRTIIQSILKKIKFSTRCKYMVIYFDENKNSKKYSECRKFKDNSGIDAARQNYPSALKIRVCRCKEAEARQQTQPSTQNIADVNAINTEFMYAMPGNGTQSVMSEYATMYFRYFMYMQCASFMGVNNLAQ